VTTRKITPSQSIQIAELREKGWSQGRLALKFRVSEGAIYYHCLKQCAISPKTWGPQNHRPGETVGTIKRQRRFSAEEDARIQALSRQGMHSNAIAREIGRAKTSVRMRLMALAMHEEMAA
jgi:hypothetical protein